MGVVWEATHLITQRRVAIKFLLRFGSPTARSATTLLPRGAGRRAPRGTPTSSEVLDVLDLEDGTPAMVMELLSGETLRARLAREGKLPLDVTVSLFLPAIAAVSASHTMGIVHRDLKPENVFLSRGASGHEVKVLDFGVAKLLSCDGEAPEADSLTGTGSTLGTPCYMAPEQTTCEKDIDARADIWALGVMLYECLAGVRPIVGSSVGQVVMKLMTDGIRPLDAVARDLPAEASALVMRMLSRAREDRPQSLAEVTRVLASLPLAPRARCARAPVGVRPPRRRRGPAPGAGHVDRGVPLAKAVPGARPAASAAIAHLRPP